MAFPVPVERVQGGDLNPGPEGLAPLTQPARVGLAGPARDQVQQPRPHPPALVTGQVHPPGQLLRPPPAVLDGLGRHVVPHVLVDTQHGHPLEPGEILVGRLQQRLDRVPHRAPPSAELAADPVDAGVLTADLLDRPPARPRRQRRPGRRDALVLLHERRYRAPRVGTQPPPLTPADPYRATHRRGSTSRTTTRP